MIIRDFVKIGALYLLSLIRYYCSLIIPVYESNLTSIFNFVVLLKCGGFQFYIAF
jgi:hypothetical protein